MKTKKKEKLMQELSNDLMDIFLADSCKYIENKKDDVKIIGNNARLITLALLKTFTMLLKAYAPDDSMFENFINDRTMTICDLLFRTFDDIDELKSRKH
jgi:hypothetical protein